MAHAIAFAAEMIGVTTTMAGAIAFAAEMIGVTTTMAGGVATVTGAATRAVVKTTAWIAISAGAIATTASGTAGETAATATAGVTGTAGETETNAIMTVAGVSAGATDPTNQRTSKARPAASAPELWSWASAEWGENAEKAARLAARLARDFPTEHEPCPVGSDRALDFAIITPPEARDPALLKKLDAVAGCVLT